MAGSKILASVLLLHAAVVFAAPGHVSADHGDPDAMTDQLCDTPTDLTGSRTVVPTPNTAGSSPAVVWNGRSYGIVWNGVTSLGFTDVAADGTVLIPPAELPVTGGARAVLAWNGTEYGAAWDNGVEVRFARISPSGVVAGAQVVVNQVTTNAQVEPSMVWTGVEYGIAWNDSRASPSDTDIYFNRITAAGAVAQGTDTRVSDASASIQQSPSVTWTGSEFAVAWADFRDAGGNGEVYAQRLLSNGTLSGSNVRITTNAGSVLQPSIAWNGTAYIVIWEDTRSTVSDIILDLLDPNLASTLTIEQQITTDANGVENPVIVSTGQEFGVAWVDEGDEDVHFTRLFIGGGAGGLDIRLTAESYETSLGQGLAFGTLGYALVYDLGTVRDVRFMGIGCHADTTPPSCPNGIAVTGNSSAGVTLGWTAPGMDPETEMAYHRVYRDGLPVGVTTAPSYTDTPRPPGSPSYTVQAVNAAGRESTGCQVVFAPEPTGQCGTDVTGSQVVAIGPTAASTALAPAIAWNGLAYGVAWQQVTAPDDEIYLTIVSAGGLAVGSPTRMSNGASISAAPSITWTGTSFGLAWQDSRHGSPEIYYATATAGGAAGPEVRVTTTSTVSNTPSLAWTGSEFGLAWCERVVALVDEVHFKRLAPDGTPIGADVPVTASDSLISGLPSLVWAGTEYGVAWHDARHGALEIYFQRISATGGLVGTDVRVTSDPAASNFASLAYTGVEYAVAWKDARAGNDEIYFRRLSAAGVPLDVDVRVTSAAGTSTAPSLAWTGSDFALSWHDLRDGNAEVYFATLDATGVKVGTDRRLTTSPSTDVETALAVGGRGMGLVYQLDSTPDQIRFIGLGCGPPDTTPPSCPSAPAEIGRTPGNPGTVTLAWGPGVDPDGDLSHYRIVKDGLDVGATTSLSYTDTLFDPTAGSVYWISTVNAAGLESPGCGSVDTGDAVPPSCPTNPLAAVQPVPLQVTLTWLPSTDARSGVRRYRVYRDNAFLAFVDAPATAYVDAAIAPGQTYNYAMVAEDWAGNLSAPCGSTSVVWISTAAITLHVTKVGDGIHADVDWNDAGLSEYTVYRSTQPNVSTELKRVPVSETQEPIIGDGVQIWFYHVQQRGL